VSGKAPSTESARRQRRSRWLWIPIAAICLMLGLVVFSQSPMFVHLEHEVAAATMNTVVAVAATMLLGWYLFLSGLTRSVLIGGVTLLGLLVLAAFLTIRRVEFTGSMKPTFIFRWSPDGAAVLEAHRMRQKSSEPDNTGSASIAISPTPHDVYEFRGPHRSGIFDGVKLARDCAAQPPRLVWRQPVGGGYAAVTVHGSE
jgi:outer membrane protein assembly factor BamB